MLHTVKKIERWDCEQRTEGSVHHIYQAPLPLYWQLKLNNVMSFSCDVDAHIQDLQHNLKKKIQVAEWQHTLSAHFPFVKAHTKENRWLRIYVGSSVDLWVHKTYSFTHVKICLILKQTSVCLFAKMNATAHFHTVNCIKLTGKYTVRRVYQQLVCFNILRNIFHPFCKLSLLCQQYRSVQT